MFSVHNLILLEIILNFFYYLLLQGGQCRGRGYRKNFKIWSSEVLWVLNFYLTKIFPLNYLCSRQGILNLLSKGDIKNYYQYHAISAKPVSFNVFWLKDCQYCQIWDVTKKLRHNLVRTSCCICWLRWFQYEFRRHALGELWRFKDAMRQISRFEARYVTNVFPHIMQLMPIFS